MYSHNRDYHPFQIKSSLKIFIQHFICISCRGYHPFQIKPLFFTPTRVSTIQSFVKIYMIKALSTKLGEGNLQIKIMENSNELVNNELNTHKKLYHFMLTTPSVFTVHPSSSI